MRSTVVDHLLLRRDPHAYDLAVSVARERLGHLSFFYPDFGKWFSQKVEPGLATGARTLLMRRVAGELAGITILKHDLEESKLCCLRVLPGFNGSGLGLRLFEDSFEMLKTEHPLLSVSEEQLPQFQRVFDHFGFRHGGRYDGVYRKGVIEHSFNGLLCPTLTEEAMVSATR